MPNDLNAAAVDKGIWSLIKRPDNYLTDHWYWAGEMHARDKYLLCRIDGKMRSARLYLYAILKAEPATDGGRRILRRWCKESRCVSPYHCRWESRWANFG